MADNDGPEVSGPASYHDKENEWFALSGLSVVDVDAKDRLRPNETVFFMCVMIQQSVARLVILCAVPSALSLTDSMTVKDEMHLK